MKIINDAFHVQLFSNDAKKIVKFHRYYGFRRPGQRYEQSKWTGYIYHIDENGKQVFDEQIGFKLKSDVLRYIRLNPDFSNTYQFLNA